MYPSMVPSYLKEIHQKYLLADKISDLAERVSQAQLMGCIYRNAGSVVVWLGQMSIFSEKCVRVFAKIPTQPTMPLQVHSDCHKDKVMPTKAIASIDPTVYKLALIGAAAVISSQWYVMSIAERFMSHGLTLHMCTKVHTYLGCTRTLLG